MVLALKYRPKRFEDVIGQEALIQTLQNSIKNNRIAHAYLFSGLRGTGKTTTARILSKALQCEKGPTVDPCEKCENCIASNENRHIDIIEMDAASNRKIEDIRELIEHTKYTPSLGRYKIFIIDEVHMLTNEAFNALLKTLEEPPEYVKFILATTDPLKLPPTILSRVQHFRFNKVPDRLIENHLREILVKESVTFEDEAIRLIVKSGNGSIRDSLTLLDQAIAYSNYNITLNKIVEMLGVINPEIVGDIFENILEQNKKNLKEIANKIKEYDIDLIIDEMILFLKNALTNGTIPLITIQRFFKIIADSKELIKYNTDNEFVLNLMFFRMSEAVKPLKIDDVIKSLEKSVDVNIETPQDKFKKLIQEIIKMDNELGSCFEKSVKLISFSENTLTWESCPDTECLNMFKRFFSSVIRPIINKIFGVNTKIEVVKCQKPQQEKKLEEKPKPTPIAQPPKEDEKVIKKVLEVFGSDVKITKIKE